MPQDFLPIPDWFSWENQGAGVAVADLAGSQHLVVLMVDDGPQQNRGLFRLGHGLTGDGVTGGWTPWIDVPGWFSWANQGADIAVADLGNDGGMDVVVLMVDDGPQQNRGLYRIGRGLHADGSLTGGWTDWIDVPDWFSWQNAGAGVAVTGPDAQGRRDLIVFITTTGRSRTAVSTGSVTACAGRHGGRLDTVDRGPRLVLLVQPGRRRRGRRPGARRRPGHSRHAGRRRGPHGRSRRQKRGLLPDRPQLRPTGRARTGARTGWASRTGSPGPTKEAPSPPPRSAASPGSSP